jgi:hypothetical protein
LYRLSGRPRSLLSGESSRTLRSGRPIS